MVERDSLPTFEVLSKSTKLLAYPWHDKNNTVTWHEQGQLGKEYREISPRLYFLMQTSGGSVENDERRRHTWARSASERSSCWSCWEVADDDESMIGVLSITKWVKYRWTSESVSQLSVVTKRGCTKENLSLMVRSQHVSGILRAKAKTFAFTPQAKITAKNCEGSTEDASLAIVHRGRATLKIVNTSRLKSEFKTACFSLNVKWS